MSGGKAIGRLEHDGLVGVIFGQWSVNKPSRGRILVLTACKASETQVKMIVDECKNKVTFIYARTPLYNVGFSGNCQVRINKVMQNTWSITRQGQFY